MSIPGNPRRALVFAHELVDAGMPVFTARLNKEGQPDRRDRRWNNWQEYTPSHKRVDSWLPGNALCAVTGIAYDVIDYDPHNDPDKDSFARFAADMGEDGPSVRAKVRTPSGGTHLYIAPHNRPTRHPVPGYPGLDYQGGNEDGTGRAFVFIPPTVRPSKVTGETAVYRGAFLDDWEPFISASFVEAVESREDGYEAAAGAGGAGRRQSLKRLERRILDADLGEQRSALLAYVDECEKRGIPRSTITEMLLGIGIPELRKGKPWTERSLATLFHRSGAIIPDATDKEARVLDGIKPRRDTSRLLSGIYNGDWLDRQEFPPLAFAIPDLVPAGLVILAGAPFCGKSLLVLRMGLEVARGGSVFGVRVQRRPVLYLALEDSPNRMQKRVRELLGEGVPVPRGFYGGHDVAPGKLPETVRAWLNAPGNAGGMVLVDVLGKVMDRPQKGETQYDRDYRVLGSLKAVCAEYPELSLIVNHHTRKAGAAGTDYLETVSGTNAITGAADTVLVIDRKRDEKEGRLRVVSRDIDPAEYAMVLEHPFGWRMDGDSLSAAADLAAIQPRRVTTLSDKTRNLTTLVCSRGNGISVEDVAAELEMTIADARNRLKRGVDKGDIRRIARGIYGPPRKVRIREERPGSK